MSLETNLQLNNELVAKNNELLTRLIQSLSAGVSLHADTVSAVQTYVETSQKNDTGTTKKAADKKSKPEPPDIESLDIRTVAALANLFGAEAKNLTAEQIEKAREYENGNKRDKFTDALSLALIDCKAAKNTTRAVLLDLCIVMLAHWSAMATIDERRTFAELYIKTPYNKRADLIPHKAESESETETTESSTDEPDYAALRKQAEGLILQLAKGGYRDEAVAILGKFGASKLTAVPDEKLADVIVLAVKELEG